MLNHIYQMYVSYGNEQLIIILSCARLAFPPAPPDPCCEGEEILVFMKPPPVCPALHIFSKKGLFLKINC